MKITQAQTNIDSQCSFDMVYYFKFNSSFVFSQQRNSTIGICCNCAYHLSCRYVLFSLFYDFIIALGARVRFYDCYYYIVDSLVCLSCEKFWFASPKTTECFVIFFFFAYLAFTHKKYILAICCYFLTFDTVECMSTNLLK